MRSLFRDNLAEALIGLAVVALAIWFVFFAWGRTGGGNASNPIRVTAVFNNAAGVQVGTDVKVAGLKVGSVAAETLDPKTFAVNVVLALDPRVKLPSDSSATVGSDGLLGGANITIMPGGAQTPLKSGDTILDTQGALDLMSLIGQFVNHSGGAAGGSAASSGSGSAGPATP